MIGEDTASLASKTQVQLSQSNLSLSEWQTLRIRNRWPVLGADYDDRNLPQELDRDASAISFHKGCYLGQETVARLDALGQVQKKLVRLLIKLSPDQAVAAAGERLFMATKKREHSVQRLRFFLIEMLA